MSEESADFEQVLSRVLMDLGITLDSGQRSALYAHYRLLKRWNDRMNLTTVRRLADVVTRHFGESLALASVLGPGDGSVVDIGSGGGFPGLPVAVYCPERQIVLVESVGKKAVFLKEAARNLANARVVAGRFEDLTECFEWAVMRAVASEGLSEPLVRSVRKVAVLVSASGSEEVGRILGLSEMVEHPLVWDSRTAILTGTVQN
ncbi:MAG: 16S rRNA (guanine(527)-N(7))-methyltransferase RsmG [Bryobacterales bacterium]